MDATGMEKTCVHCNQAKPLSEFYLLADGRHHSWCVNCNKSRCKEWHKNNPERARALRKKWAAENPERRKEIARAWSNKHKEDRHAYYRKLMRERPDDLRAFGRKHIAELKKKIIEAYGGKCACCGESTYEFLTIDHINGRDKGDKLMGAALYRALKNQGFPKDNYQLLCFNCNSAKGLYGQCPHKKVM
jgi:5-methylcytosine-specific restriction endonuclease McrA